MMRSLFLGLSFLVIVGAAAVFSSINVSLAYVVRERSFGVFSLSQIQKLILAALFLSNVCGVGAFFLVRNNFFGFDGVVEKISLLFVGYYLITPILAITSICLLFAYTSVHYMAGNIWNAQYMLWATQPLSIVFFWLIAHKLHPHDAHPFVGWGNITAFVILVVAMIINFVWGR